MEIVNGELIVTYTDGTQDNLGNVSTGEPTVDSRLIFTLQDDGTYEVTLDTKYKEYSYRYQYSVYIQWNCSHCHWREGF